MECKLLNGHESHLQWREDVDDGHAGSLQR